MIVNCQKCRREFDAQGAWQKLCLSCYRERERERTGTGDLSGLERRADRLITEAYEAGRQRGFEEGYEVASAKARRPNGHLSPGLLRELVLLCHPDRHPPERFELANRITAELVSMRNGR